MDLEHTNLGCHCEVVDCNQRDFLPFTCDVCKKRLCLVHKTYTAHNCTESASKDITSIDCPMCQKTIKFAKSAIVDEIWEEHYLTSCTGTNTSSKVILKCYSSSCKVNLGPSNKYICKKCKQYVCLSHRLPEDHSCIGTRATIQNRLVPVSQKQSVTKATTKLNVAQNQMANKLDVTPNAIYAQSSYTVQSKGINSCPLCEFFTGDPQLLQVHIDEAHPDPQSDIRPSKNQLSGGSFEGKKEQSRNVSSAVSSNDFNPSINFKAREVCPMCQARFMDATELVAHFEKAHSDTDSKQSVNRQRDKVCVSA